MYLWHRPLKATHLIVQYRNLRLPEEIYAPRTYEPQISGRPLVGAIRWHVMSSMYLLRNLRPGFGMSEGGFEMGLLWFRCTGIPEIQWSMITEGSYIYLVRDSSTRTNYRADPNVLATITMAQVQFTWWTVFQLNSYEYNLCRRADIVSSPWTSSVNGVPEAPRER